MRTFFLIFQSIISILLIIVVIMQSRGNTSGMTFGGAGETYRSKRGLEKVLFYATIILAALFASSSIILLVVK